MAVRFGKFEQINLILWLMRVAPFLTVGNPDAKRLYDDLMSSYNRLVRPVRNNSDTLTVRMNLKLSQLIDVNMKNQIMTTNMWVNQEWSDHKLRWDPREYGGVRQLYVPAEQIWLPDIVLYNSADGNYEVTIMTKAIIHDDGKVVWNPPAIYKSSCQIDVQYFPFDRQECHMKFGSWSHDGYKVDLKHLKEIENSSLVPLGIDLSEFYLSVEWDIMSVPAKRKEKFYACCAEPYPDITFNITLRRKTLFYTVNLIIPCVGIGCLSIVVFYLPSDSGEKITLCISILLSLIFFFLVLSEIIPSTSLALPLLGKYLLFTMILLTVTVVVTTVVLNVHFRSPSTHKLKPWVRKVFIRTLPKILLMREPQYKNYSDMDDKQDGAGIRNVDGQGRTSSVSEAQRSGKENNSQPFGRYTVEEIIIQELQSSPSYLERKLPERLETTIHNAMFIAQHIDNQDDYDGIKEDWKYVAMVLDRLFLWLFSITCLVGTIGILLQSPSLYDTEKPIDVKLSRVAQMQEKLHDWFDI
ncbi:acetylcholine receptor subunit alpha-like 1 isoform X1 [Limulus polyphemus]|uniref:Acetylcholine receptor subunit alpha-like 1 isoform X1 n=2 Tax=Limulus polyphemus TaxID=6850 RepID=A0ABM1SI05_LIMPO|nr:acetylcholine receptor subunit alpha-like 1 isoform X1 [Limulus polyphemus]